MFCLLRKSRVALSKSVISLLPHQREKSNSVRHPLFKHSQVSSNVWRLEEAYFDSWNLANMYFVRGSDADLLVDTGIGVHYLPSYLLWSKLREDKEKPLIVALTHTHFGKHANNYSVGNNSNSCLSTSRSFWGRLPICRVAIGSSHLCARKGAECHENGFKISHSGVDHARRDHSQTCRF